MPPAEHLADAGSREALDRVDDDILAHVVKQLGSVARPYQIRFTQALPKTRSGRILRLLLREIATGDVPSEPS